jgi:hypothetical protein
VQEGTLRELFGFRGAVPPGGVGPETTPIASTPAPATTPVVGPSHAASPLSADFLADEESRSRPARTARAARAAQEDAPPADALVALLRPPPRPAEHALQLRLYEAEIEHTKDRTRLVSLHYEAARTRAERLDDRKGADESLEAALKLNPRHRAALQMLRRSHVHAQRWDQAVKAIDAEIGLLRDPQSHCSPCARDASSS